MKKFKNLQGTQHGAILTEHCLDEMQEAGLEPKNGSSYASAQIPLANAGDVKSARFTRNLTSWCVYFSSAKGISRSIDVPPALKALHKRGDIEIGEIIGGSPGWVNRYTIDTQEALNLMVKTLKAL